ncbi:hypothetical protein TKK_0017533 [Trichogramma kaykai]|uniref:Conserved oligomeric Golgi complex subunit 6 n=1 Tax=Trichogramma kaykai TaxID=54128 RepID=A0ABD2W342_9HYME
MENVPGDIESEDPEVAEIRRKIRYLVDERPENDPEVIEALKYISTFYTENTEESLKNLETTLKERGQMLDEEEAKAYKAVKDILDRMNIGAKGMGKHMDEVTDLLQKAKSDSTDIIAKAKKLQFEVDKVAKQQEIIAALIETFTLTDEETAILQGSSKDAPITEEFFSVLDRAQEIHNNCQQLLKLGMQTLALDIMQDMTSVQEAALERIYRWMQTQCRHVENEQLIPLLVKSMSKLQARPVLFKYILDEYCTNRRSTIVSAFIDALTLGKGQGSDSNPIEMHANDPKRYVGDILAWLHQAIPVEKENLLVLLKLCDKTNMTDQIDQALSTITEGLCHPLKSRIEHIVAVEAPSTVLYSVTTLIRYYRATLKPIMHDSVLDRMFGDLLDLSEKSFVSRLQRETRTALGERAEPPANDLVPSPSVSRLLSLLNEVLSVASIAEDREKDMLQIVSCIIDPLLQEVNETASRLPTVDMAVYLLNCMHQIHSTLALYEYMDQRLERLQAQSDAQIDTLTSEQASSLVAHLNLGPIYTILQGKDQGPLSTIPGMDPLSIKEFTNKLDTFLVMPDVLLLPQISLLQSSVHRSSTQRRAFEVIGAIYKQLYEACHDPRNQYQNPGALFTHTPDQLSKALLEH